MNILVAEDEAVNAISLKNMLERSGHRVLTVDGGEKAIEALEAHPEIDLLLADIQMPGMDGLDLVREVRSRPEVETLPVIFISGVSDADTVRAAVGLRSEGYILKPILRPTEVLERIEAVLDEVNVVLRPAATTCARLGIDDRAYRSLLTALRRLVQGAETAVAEGSTSFGPLGKAARRVGAERLANALEPEAGNPAGAEVLLRELKALSAELERRGIPLP